ncbi:Hypothetical protein D9617_18g034030 [Elsinoe fawcettii]|nr:Hypothetical protein D9617_18g034030 [Elsinoe fawcettii]
MAVKERPQTWQDLDKDAPAYKGTLREQAVPSNFILYLYRVWEYDAPLDQAIDVKQIMISIFPHECSQSTTDNIRFLRYTAFDYGESTGSEQAVGQIQKWLSICKDGHTICKGLNDRSTEPLENMPTRLLDLSSIKPDIRLISSSKLSKCEPYMTLSYTWGDPKTCPLQITTTTSTRASHESRIPWTDLPLTHQQTITLARTLGISYLWIDALCIIQGPDGDFITQAPRMQDVYGRSYLNIAAADSSNPYQGLHRDIAPHDNSLPLLTIEIGDKHPGRDKAFAVVRSDYWQHQVLNSKLYTRAWVFQERMLAPRMVHFTTKGLVFTCPALTATLMFPDGLPRQISSLPRRDSQWRQGVQGGVLGRELDARERGSVALERFWTTAVREYSACDLTNGKDKLVALSGVKALIERSIGSLGGREEYLGGVWRFMLAEQLGWRVVGPGKRGTEYRAPSWSWASVDGRIDMPGRVKLDRDYVLDILEHGVDASDQADPEKRARESQRRSLTVDGTMWELRFAQSGTEWLLVDPDDNNKQVSSFQAWFDESPPGGESDQSKTVLVLLAAYTRTVDEDDVPSYTGRGILVRSPNSDQYFERYGSA